MKRALVLIACAITLVLPAGAQQGTRASTTDEASYIVKTLLLHHLSNSDAVLLLTPYVANRGGVYPIGQSIHAVTVRGSPATIAEAERILAQYDRSPATISLNFQLIAADNSTKRDASLAGIDSVLRGVLKFTGYHLLTVAVVNVSEGSMTSQTLSADGQDYRLSCSLTDISGTNSDATVHVRVDLQRVGMISVGGNRTVDPILLSTGVTIPIGHTVVLGSSAEGATAAGEGRALILTVRPQAAPRAKEDR
jgi:hypothetical protein